MAEPSSNGEGALALACEFAARNPGNFVPSQLAVAQAVRQRLGLDTVFVLPERARRRSPWLDEITQAGCALTFLPEAARRRPAALLRILRDSRSRIVHSHYTWFDLDALYAGRRANAAVVWHVRNGLFGYPLKRRVTDLVKARTLARACDAVVGVSEQVGRDLRRRGFPAGKIRVIENAVVLDRFRHPSDQRGGMRRALGLADDAFVVLAFGRPPFRKGIDVVVDAVSRMRTVIPEVALVVVADRGALEQFFTARGLDRQPVWLTVVPGVDDVAGLYAAADVFVSASREEGFAFAVGEAMASGLPVVGSDILGTSHYWRAPGFIRYPVEDSKLLAGRLSELASGEANPDLGASNRRWAFEHLGMDRYVDEMISCYADVLRPRR